MTLMPRALVRKARNMGICTSAKAGFRKRLIVNSNCGRCRAATPAEKRRRDPDSAGESGVAEVVEAVERDEGLEQIEQAGPPKMAQRMR